MKDAILWKRILNGAVRRTGKLERIPDVETNIITSPIILAPVTKSMGETINWDDYDDIEFPFPEFWIEGTDIFDDGGHQSRALWGANVIVERDDAGISTVVMLFVVSTPEAPPTLVGIVRVKINATGKYINGPMGDAWAEQFTDQQGLQNNSTMLAQVLDNLSLLGCKNVSLDARANEPKQVARAIKRHGGTPDSYRYHVLVVRQAGAKQDSPSRDIGIMPSHKVRGHYQRYGPEYGRGLYFGKYSGKFWVDAFTRGDKKNGIVEKDYKIPA